MGRLARLRAACHDVLRDVVIPDPFDLTAFCAEVSRQRGRPLYLHPIPVAAGAGIPCGLWLTTAGGDHIFFAADATPLHREHIILHEVGHLLCGHAATTAEAVDWSALLLPDLAPDLVARVLARTSYEAWQEQMAEMLASIILGTAAGRAGESRASDPLHDVADVFGLAGRTDRRG